MWKSHCCCSNAGSNFDIIAVYDSYYFGNCTMQGTTSENCCCFCCCFSRYDQVISPSSEHLFQTTSHHHMEAWVSAMQETTEEALKQATVSTTKKPTFSTSSSGGVLDPPIYEPVGDAMNLILSVPGNQECADCGSIAGEWCVCTVCEIVWLIRRVVRDLPCAIWWGQVWGFWLALKYKYPTVTFSGVGRKGAGFHELVCRFWCTVK